MVEELTREQVIQKLIHADFQNNRVESMLEEGCKGYKNYTNSELVEAYMFEFLTSLVLLV